jgi:hypothetical protein
LAASSPDTLASSASDGSSAGSVGSIAGGGGAGAGLSVSSATTISRCAALNRGWQVVSVRRFSSDGSSTSFCDGFTIVRSRTA